MSKEYINLNLERRRTLPSQTDESLLFEIKQNIMSKKRTISSFFGLKEPPKKKQKREPTTKQGGKKASKKAKKKSNKSGKDSNSEDRFNDDYSEDVYSDENTMYETPSTQETSQYNPSDNISHSRLLALTGPP